MNQGDRQAGDAGMQEDACAIIFTALPLEAIEVLRHIGDTVEVESASGTVYDCGIFVGERTNWRIAVVECGDGNSPVAHFVHDACSNFDPDVLLFVGVAGGLKDVAVGDVVACTKVYGYHSGKAAVGFDPRPKLEVPDTALEQRARAVCRRNRWVRRIKCDAPPPAAMKAVVGPIASGEQVVAERESEVRQVLRAYYGDALVVEMEGYGFMHAARHVRASALVVRGVSDLCDQKKEARDSEGWQPRAAAHAAAFAFEILARYCPRRPLMAKDAKPWPLGDTTDRRVESEPPDTDQSLATAEQIKAALIRNSTEVVGSAVAPAEWIDRVAEHELERVVAWESHRIVCVLGAPGTGKTTLLAKFSQRCVQNDYALLAVKADSFQGGTLFEESLRERCELGMAVVDAIQCLAKSSRVFVVVDQLDALASLVDLHSSRLNEILDFVSKCSKIENVTVVCSCREFEYRHDVRFNVLNPKIIHLDLPEWEQIDAKLKQRGVDGMSSWPEPFREMLRTPQHLAIFLQKFEETGSVDPTLNYQQMLDEMWSRTVSTDERRAVVYRLTQQLIDTESLWAPAASFEEAIGTVNELVAANVLVRDGAQLGFRHQTLLEHAKARLFTRSQHSLVEYVLERQDAIFLRPTLWSVLAYFREADPKRYASELRALFHADLRLHVRYLLIDFLGQQEEPVEEEVVQMAGRMQSEEDRHRVLFAIQGREAWFRELKSSHLAAAMDWSGAAAWPMVGVLQNALSFARSECVELISRHWLPKRERHDFIVQSLFHMEEWDDKAVKLVCRIVREAPRGRLWWVQGFARKVSDSAPSLAPLIVGENVRHFIRSELDPIQASDAWYELEEIAERAPTEFLREVWGLFVECALRWHGQRTSSVIRCYSGWMSGLLDREFPNHFPEAMKTAVQEAARQDPEAFLEVTRPSWTCDNTLVHVMIVMGLSAAPERLAQSALEYLCGDPRRLILGEYSHDLRYSEELVAGIAEYLDHAGSRRLADYIVAWSQYEPGQLLEAFQVRSDEEARVRFLRHIPPRHLPSEAKELLRPALVEAAENETSDSARVRSGFVREIPPMRANEMERASDEEIVEVLLRAADKNVLDSEWREDEDGFVAPGGARSAVPELVAFAKAHPARLPAILEKLNARGAEGIVADVVHGLSELKVPYHELEELILKLAAGREPSEEFRSSAAYAIYRRCPEGTGASDEMCAALEAWLALPWESDRADSALAEEGEETTFPEYPQSILWGTGSERIAAGGAFWPLMALTKGLLLRRPPACNRWLASVEAHVARGASPAMWKCFCRELRRIGMKEADHRHGEELLRKLFQQYPDVESSSHAVRLVANVSFVLSQEFLKDYLNTLRMHATPESRQAFGELLVLLSVRENSREWAVPMLQELLSDEVDSLCGLEEASYVGVAFAAGQLWDDPGDREHVVGILERVTQHPTERVAQAFGMVFWAPEDFADDKFTRRLLQAILEHPKILHDSFVADLAGHLAKLCRFQRSLVLEVTRAIAERFGSDVADIRTDLYRAGEYLVDIAMTLQRYPETRVGGLELLETFMRYGVDASFRVLADLDCRPGQTPGARSEIHRRRRRRPASSTEA
ncbi:hypothetical protein [Maioricimonas sp. JC845]|uniref:phosphorylase family protein n=1 Tax=Maioricimonas sp. JC845 TaxID=3232138 RepID=UPI0034577D1C